MKIWDSVYILSPMSTLIPASMNDECLKIAQKPDQTGLFWRFFKVSLASIFKPSDSYSVDSAFESALLQTHSNKGGVMVLWYSHLPGVQEVGGSNYHCSSVFLSHFFFIFIQWSITARTRAFYLWRCNCLCKIRRNIE